MTDPATYIEGRTVQEQMNSLIGYVDERSAEVATDAIASDVAQVATDAANAHSDALAAAASAAAAAGTLANAVKKTGESSQSIAGDISIGGTLAAGATSLTGNTSVTGDVTVSGDLTVSNDATLSGVTAVTTEATGTFSNQAANSIKLKNELDNYTGIVRTAGNQTIADVKTFSSSPVGPTEATGTFSTKLATSDKVKNELDNYAAMVRTTGNQEITGHKYFGVPNYGNGPNLKDGSLDITDIQSQRVHDFNLVDANNVMVAGFRWVVQTNGEILLQAQLRKTDGTTKFVTIGDNS